MIVYWLKHRGTMFPVPGGDVVIGRSAQQCLVVLGGERVSRRHAVVREVDGQLFISDMRSRNGTFVNGRRVRGTTPLSSGDAIQVGEEKLTVVSKASKDLAKTIPGQADDASTVTERNAVGLVEELVARAAETGERIAVSRTITEMIDAVIESAQSTGHRLGIGETVRLIAAAKIVAGWFDDGSLDAWAEGVRETLETDQRG